MNAFYVGAGVTALVGAGIGAIAAAATPAADEVGPHHHGAVRTDVQLWEGLAVPAAMGSAFLGMTTDTPALYLGASLLAGVAAGGAIGSAFASIHTSRATA